MPEAPKELVNAGKRHTTCTETLHPTYSGTPLYVVTCPRSQESIGETVEVRAKCKNDSQEQMGSTM